LKLLERIIMSSSKRGDVVLDPFCGCGTTIDAAQALDRQWIGIDIADVAIRIIEDRLTKRFGGTIKGAYDYRVYPTSLEHAHALAVHSRFRFQEWAIESVGGEMSRMRSGDAGIDGRLRFQEEPGGPMREIMISVKSGGTGPRDVSDLLGVIEREGAAIGVLVTLREPTQKMRVEAGRAGSYASERWGTDYPRIQIVTVGELLKGKGVVHPIVERAIMKTWTERAALGSDRATRETS
jgi:site-specific DNA-methyltransferase (adenine-specific)